MTMKRGRASKAPSTNENGDSNGKEELTIDSSSDVCAVHRTSIDADKEVNQLKHADAVLRLNLPLTPLTPSSPSSPPSKKRRSNVTIPDINIPLSSSNKDTSSSSCSLSLLEKLLYPLSSSTFLTTCFRQKAVHVKSNNAQRVKELNSKFMFDLNAQKIFEETSSDSIFLWIPDADSTKDNSNHHNKSNTSSNGGDGYNSCSSNSNSTSNSAGDTSNREKNHPNSDCSNKDGKEQKVEKPVLRSIEIQDPEMAYILHTSSNYASYCRAPPELEQPLVYNLLKDTGIGCGQYTFDHDSSISPQSATSIRGMGRGEVETFIGTRGHVTDWHIDFQENFTIQLSGCKKWYLKQSPIKHPLRGVTPHYSNTSDVIENQLKATKLSSSASNFQYDFEDDNVHVGPCSGCDSRTNSNSFGNIDCVTLNQGDVLYFPAGMWHKVETVEYGVSINISLMGSNYASIVCDAMEHLLLKRDEWREVICNKNTANSRKSIDDQQKVVANGNGSTHHESDVVVQKLESLLGDLPDIIREFHKNGGAHCILPPVLRQAPNYVLSNDDENDVSINEVDYVQESEIENDDDERMKTKEITDNDDDSKDDQEKGKSKSVSSNGNDDDNIEYGNIGGDDSDVDEDDVIDIELFECPQHRDYSRPSSKHRLVKNPLATIMKMTDVTSFYSKRKISTNNTSQKEGDLYILNVSYAGNEMHESCIRTVFRDRSQVLNKLWKIEQEGTEDYENIFEGKSLPDALFYFGYFNCVQY